MSSFAAAAVGVGIVYHLACLDAGFDFGVRYYPAPSAVLSFATGSLIYFLRARGAFNVGASVGVISLAVWIANMVAAGSLLPEHYVYGASYYIGTLAFAFVVAGLADARPAALWARFDRALGELAYPVFLVQWLCGFLVALAFFPGMRRGWALTLVATPVILGASIGLAKLNDIAIEPPRRRLRENSATRTPQLAAATAGAPDSDGPARLG